MHSAMKDVARLMNAAGKPVRFIADHSSHRVNFAAGNGHFYEFSADEGQLIGTHTTDEGEYVGEIPVDFAGKDIDDPAALATAIATAIDTYHAGLNR